MKKTSPKKTPPSSSTPSAPLAEAKAMDEAIRESEGGGQPGAVNIMLGEPAGEKKGRGRPKGSTKKDPAEPQAPDPFVVGIWQSMVPTLVTQAKKAGWSSPETKVGGAVLMSEETWCKLVADAGVACTIKYFPDASEYAPELTLIAFVLPWVAENLIRILAAKAKQAKAEKEANAKGQEPERNVTPKQDNAERKSNGNSGDHGNRQDDFASRTDGPGAAPPIAT